LHTVSNRVDRCPTHGSSSSNLSTDIKSSRPLD
jgi:hypothetical protein